jgi:hypothetical protein
MVIKITISKRPWSLLQRSASGKDKRPEPFSGGAMRLYRLHDVSSGSKKLPNDTEKMNLGGDAIRHSSK